MIDWCRLWAALVFYMPNHDETFILIKELKYYELL